MDNVLILITLAGGLWTAVLLVQVRNLGQRLRKAPVRVERKEQQHPSKG